MNPLDGGSFPDGPIDHGLPPNFYPRLPSRPRPNTDNDEAIALQLANRLNGGYFYPENDAAIAHSLAPQEGPRPDTSNDGAMALNLQRQEADAAFARNLQRQFNAEAAGPVRHAAPYRAHQHGVQHGPRFQGYVPPRVDFNIPRPNVNWNRNVPRVHHNVPPVNRNAQRFYPRVAQRNRVGQNARVGRYRNGRRQNGGGNAPTRLTRDEAADIDCPICLEKLTDEGGQWVSLQCDRRHALHVPCYQGLCERAQNGHVTCPSCRAPHPVRRR